MEDIPLHLEVSAAFVTFFVAPKKSWEPWQVKRVIKSGVGQLRGSPYPGLLESARKPHGGVTQNIQDTDPPKRYRKLGNVEINVLSI